MTDLDKAREWAAEIAESRQTNIRPDAFAVARIIQSLPDHWVDADEVREILDIFTRESDSPTNPGNVSSAYRECVEALEYLLTPKPQTLWHLIEAGNPPGEYKFMQCSVASWGGAKGVIFQPARSKSIVIVESGGYCALSNSEITPLPDLPKLEWPGSEVVEPPALPEGMRLADHERYGRVVVSPRMDSDGEYKAFYSEQVDRSGAAWKYTHESELTFLDGVGA